MSALERQLFPARRDGMARAVDSVQDFCRRHGVAAGDCSRLTLIVEELFTNTIVHGHGGDSDAPVRIGLGASSTQLMLHYEDDAAPFDPLRYLQQSAPDPTTLVTDRAPGGYGLPLVAELAEQLDYAYADGANRLRLRLVRSL